MKLTCAYRARLSSISRTLFFTGLAVLCPLLFFIDATSAACSMPNANAGAREYFTSENRMKYCDGTNWVDMMSAGTLGACSNAGRRYFVLQVLRGHDVDPARRIDRRFRHLLRQSRH